jgi:DNA-binding CsgD family transcriptional regulator
MPFIDFLLASRRVKTPEALCILFIETMTALGYDLINFSIIKAYNFPAVHQGFGKINTYPLAWQQHYNENHCRHIDPVAICATSMFRPFLWSELERLMRLTKRQRKFLRDAEAAGLHNGIGIPFKGPMCQVAGIALATSEKEPKALPPFDLIVAYCNHFFEVYHGLVAPRTFPFDPDSTLTLRECQILELAGRNMIDVEIAEHLGIKASTVDSHMRRVFTKLQARTRTGAVITALKMGLIDP